MQRLSILLFLFLTFILPYAFAQQTNGGNNAGVKDTCEISGGTFTGSESGNWACCWSDWGCYGCVDGNCKIKCHTARCRKANAAARISTNMAPVTGLAPVGEKAPIVPMIPRQRIKMQQNFR